MSDRDRSSIDDIVDVYKQGVDVTLIVENLRRSIDERLEALMQFQAFVEEMRRAGPAAGG